MEFFVEELNFKMSILKKIFIFVLFLFPLGEIFRIDFGNGLVIKPLDMGIGILIFFWLFLKFFNKEKIKRTDILIPFLLFTLSGLFALIINNLHLSLNEFVISFLYLSRWIIYAGLFFVVSDFDGEFREKISRTLIILGSLMVGLGYVQYLYYSNLENLRYLGWDEHMYRLFSSFLDPNFAGAFFVLFFLFLINIFLKKKNILVGLLSILTLGSVFLTFSRSGLIMLLVASCLLFILNNKKILIVFLLIFVFIVLGISSKYFNISNINLFRVVSSEARLETAKNAIEIFRRNPVFGVGFNAYRYAQYRYGFRNVASISSHADSSPDNSLLFVLATTGIVGFSMFIFLWFKILKSVSVLGIASIVGIFVDSLFINSLFYSLIMFWLWITLALSAKSKT
jgi:O-antigen ligase